MKQQQHHKNRDSQRSETIETERQMEEEEEGKKL